METMEIFTSMEEKLVARANGLKQPINGILELTPLCNMNCDMCYVRLSRSEMEARGRLRSGAEWLELGRQMAEAGTLFVLLTGGEPLTHPDFREIYLGLKRMGMILTINTNGTLIDREWAEFFGKMKPRRVNVTLYGADEETYGSLCHNPGGFQKTVDAIRLLRANGVAVKLNGSITPANENQIEQIIEIARELDVPYKLDTYMYPGCRERSLPYDRQARLLPEAAAGAQVRANLYGLPPEAVRACADSLFEKMASAPEYTTGLSCRAGSSSYMVNWQGRMRPCIMVDEPSVDAFELGFEKAWKQIVALTSGISLSPVCSACELRGACQVCGACALLETGRYDGTPDYMCRYTAQILRLMRQARETYHE